MKAIGPLTLLLLLISIVLTQASIFDWDDERLFKHDEAHNWLTTEQKAELEPLRNKHIEFRDKTLEFYKQLPKEQKTQWDNFYKKYCVVWLKDVASDDEIKELKEMESKKDQQALFSKMDSYKTRLADEYRSRVDAWTEACTKLLKEDLSRKRREIDKNFNDFIQWMTEEQKQSVIDMKAAGNSFDEIRDKGNEFFGALATNRQVSLKEDFKEKCKAYFEKISNPDEVERMKSLYNSGKEAEIRSIVKTVVARLTGDDKQLAIKMEKLCTDVFDVKVRVHKDIDSKINKRLSWMTNEQKEEVKKMYADGKPQAEIRARIFEFLSAIEGPAGLAAKEQTRKECYKWMEEVASAEEIAALHKMHETDHDACKKKVREFIGRLPTEKKEEVEKNLPFCEKVWYGEHTHHSAHGHRRHLAARHRRHLHAIDKFLDWLKPEQKRELEEIENSGAHFDNVIAQVKKFYDMLPEEKKAELKANFKSQCFDWVKEVATPEELENILKMHQQKDHEELKKKLTELESRLTEEQKHTVEHVREVCLGVWELQSTRKRRAHRNMHEHNFEDAVNTYLNWMTIEDKEKMKDIYDASNREGFHDGYLKILESSSNEIGLEGTDKLKAACKHYGKDILGEENINIIKQLRHNGATYEDILQEVDEMIEEIADPKRKIKASRLATICKKIYSRGRSRRSHHHHHNHSLDFTFQKYLTWLDDSQKDELKKMKEIGHKEEMYEKIRQYFEVASGGVKEKAVEELQSACKHYIKEFVGEEKAATLKAMKETGTPFDEIAKEVAQAIEQIPDEAVKSRARAASNLCRKVFGVTKRLRRDHKHKHSLEEAMDKYLSWLTDDQKIVIKSIYDVGDRNALYEKVMEFFNDAAGEVKGKATSELKDACKHYVKDLIGEENGNLLSEMKETGASNDAIATKVEEMIEAITDETKKEQAIKASTVCRKIYGVEKRLKRDHHHEHNLEEALEKYLTWLNDEQEAEVKKIYEGGEREAVYKKVLEFFDAATGETKEKASMELKSACKHYIEDSIGKENAEKIKEMKENGVSKEEIAAKVDEFIAKITDEEKKTKALRASAACKKIYGVGKRFRRDHHHHEHNLEEALEKYLTWLNDEQKAEVRKIYEGGDKEAVNKKVLEFFDAATGETKEKASMELDSACKHYIEDFIGKENAEKIKEMKESGVSKEEIAAKVDEFIAKITDEEKKAKALRASAACKKFYGVAKRFRRDHHHHEHNLEEALEKYLTWLNDEQKAEVKKIYEGGEREAVYKKVLEFFDAATGETKEKASMELKSACKHYIEDFIGNENAEKIKEMKESGVSKEEIAAKVDEFIAKITDEEKKAKALRASAACKKIYGVAKRFRRDHHHDAQKFEEAMQKYLSWLNDEQKTQVKKIYGTGDRIATYNEVMEMFESASGDKKVKATSQLKAACRHYIKHFIGDQNVEVIKIMKQNGATSEAISSKIDEFIADLKDEKKKGQAEKVATACKKIYGVKNRNKRNEHEIKLEEALTTYLTWLNEEQKTELKQLKENNQKKAIHTKIMEYFETATGDVKDKAREELKNGCKHYFKLFLGEEKTDELKALKDSGASMEEMLKKLNEAIETIADETLKAKAQKVSASCQKIYGVPKVRRHLAAKYHRHHPRHHHFFNE